jgi:hypothetical protein
MTATKLTEVFTLSAQLSLAQIGLQTAAAIDYTITTSIATAATAVKYCDRVYALLSSESARHHYRAAWRALEIIWAIAVFLFLVVQREVDRIVDECENDELIENEPNPVQNEPQAAIAPTEVVEVAIVAPVRPVRNNGKGGKRDRRGVGSGVAIEA